ncbi:hypothetical protein QWY86_16190 [Pedobacter aquatilis]|uniref:hypothetical protein n=1 Tax=Pedobacter aquatilis TaxID=351343 RepID=UPI0025B543E0|nr:hypothetical protein [Pedobacter aquatilis]MDN3588225.1 hypothetical protein [Pedobacter aquatilis]
MSILSEISERKAVLETAKILRHFERFDLLLLSAPDAQDLRRAENLLKGIIQNNGYAIRYSKKRGTAILKLKP